MFADLRHRSPNDVNRGRIIRVDGSPRMNAGTRIKFDDCRSDQGVMQNEPENLKVCHEKPGSGELGSGSSSRDPRLKAERLISKLSSTRNRMGIKAVQQSGAKPPTRKATAPRPPAVKPRSNISNHAIVDHSIKTVIVNDKRSIHVDNTNNTAINNQTTAAINNRSQLKKVTSIERLIPADIINAVKSAKNMPSKAVKRLTIDVNDKYADCRVIDKDKCAILSESKMCRKKGSLDKNIGSLDKKKDSQDKTTIDTCAFAANVSKTVTADGVPLNPGRTNNVFNNRTPGGNNAAKMISPFRKVSMVSIQGKPSLGMRSASNLPLKTGVTLFYSGYLCERI